MSTDNLIFFFSALGAFNGFILSIYFAVMARRKIFTNYFLALLMLMLSIRIMKSVFFYFNPDLANIFIQIGLSACILIGPFLYLFLKTQSGSKTLRWPLHIIPYITGITILGIMYPYVEHYPIWRRWIVKGINYQWLIYILASTPYILPILGKIRAKDNLKKIDVWLLSIYLGVAFIWLAYTFGTYASYIVGALSFSFVLYLIILLFIFRNIKTSTFFQEKEKYKNKEINQDTLAQLEDAIQAIASEEMFLDSNLTLDAAAKKLDVPKHAFSQYLNEKKEKSFSTYINELRISKAKDLLLSNEKYTIEGLGYNCGYNSKSTFFSNFKKITGMTPAQYQKSIS